ncbi:Na/Pi symporter [Methylomarinum sp. Ch1-1]|uniref:Na/Pi symporter n=1 Tax=Methylomarinum roseum TaxID=3067653 RepID=A0AAU7NTA8_9GAMM
MIKNGAFFGFLVVLAIGFWLSADFKTIAAGIAIFLFGMLALQQGFRFFSGGILEQVLRSMTDSLVKRLSFGIVATMMMQSSSLLTVLVISFISAGLLDLAAGIGIIFGANLGTTTGAWLVAGFGIKVNISAYAMPLLVFGIMLILNKSKNIKGGGYILAGIGFLFLGIHYMKEGFDTFKDTLDLSEYAMTGWQGLLVFVALGIVATVIIQASGATMVLIITALASQQITYENALALAIGSNIGTTVTAILGALGANIEGKRLAGAHLLFNVFTAVVALLMLNQFVWLVDRFCEFVGIAADDYTLKLAAFHTLFNLVGVVVMLPLATSMASLLEKVMTEKIAAIDKPRYLTQSAIQFPDAAVESVVRETIHLYENAVHIILKTLGLHRRDVYSDRDLNQVIARFHKISDYDIDEAYERSVKGIYSAIIEFISQARFAANISQSERLLSLRESNVKLVEAVKGMKHLQKNLIKHNRSYNHFLVSEYDRIRYQIALLIRELETVKKNALSDELPLLSLDKYKGSIKEQRLEAIETIENLIRERKISSLAGTSLLNDHAYLYDILVNLIAMAEAVFINYSDKSIEAEQELALTDHELLDVINPKPANNHE